MAGSFDYHRDLNKKIKETFMSGTPLAQEAAKALNPQPSAAVGRIDIELTHMHESIANLDGCVERLYSKLQPVLGPSSPVPGSAEEDFPEMSMTARQVRVMAERIVSIRVALEEMYDRLEC